MRLRYVRKTLRNMTQVELAKKSGVSQATISDLETGESKSPWGTNLVSLARVLRVNPEWLGSGKGQMEAAEEPLPPEAIEVAKDWLLLEPDSRTKVHDLIRTMVKASKADSPAVSDARVEETYGLPKAKRHAKR